MRTALERGADPVALAVESHRRALATEGIFTALVPAETVVAAARAAQEKARAGMPQPLLGLTFSVKDNLHVAGMVTTSNCPALALHPQESALVIARVQAAGAVLIGKNTMDQFATGLNGTRMPDPLCRNAIDGAYIPGGSSSGSAVAVARHVVSFALGSDTGGSGRVPAACNGIVGLKPTIGLVSTRGLLFNSRLLDCVPVFAHTLADAQEVLRLIVGYDPHDPWSRRDADSIDLDARPPAGAPLAVPKAGQMLFFGDEPAAQAHAANLALLRHLGHRLEETDFAPFEEAGRLVFQSAMVAERLVDYGDIVRQQPQAIHPAVRTAIEPGQYYGAEEVFRALYRMRELKRQAEIALGDVAALIVPTVPTLFTISEMLAEPMARNTIMGTYSYFVNPMDLCAVSVPGVPRADGLPSALSFVGLAGTDGMIAALARAFEAAVQNRES